MRNTDQVQEGVEYLHAVLNQPDISAMENAWATGGMLSNEIYFRIEVKIVNNHTPLLLLRRKRQNKIEETRMEMHTQKTFTNKMTSWVMREKLQYIMLLSFLKMFNPLHFTNI
jgi:hypothetical protein